MRHQLFLSALAFANVALAAVYNRAAKCNADNCARAVTGTLGGMTASHYADCQYFMACIVTPAAVTMTSTLTVTPAASTVTGVNFAEAVIKRDPQYGNSNSEPTAPQPIVPINEPSSSAGTVIAYGYGESSSSIKAVSASTPSNSATQIPAYGYAATTTSPSTQSVSVSTGTTSPVTQAVSISTGTTSTGPVTVTGGAVTRCPSAVPTYASACSGTVRYSSACSCFGVAQSTVTGTASTVTATVTTTLPASVVTIQPTAPPLCANAGLQFAYFRDFTSNNAATYDPTVNKATAPQVEGVTEYLHFSGGDGNVYGGEVPLTNFALEHRGYLFAPESGNYSFALSNLDQSWFLWIGSQAYSGWNRNNAQQEIYNSCPYSGCNGVSSSGTYYMTLKAATYYPIRMVYRGGDTPGSFDFTITAPSGYQLISNSGSSAKQTLFVVQYSCDGVLAPSFQPFGQET